MSNGMYIGVKGEVPIYAPGNPVETLFNVDNLDEYFYLSCNNTNYLKMTDSTSGIKFEFNNASSGAMISLSFIAMYNLSNLVLQYYYRYTSSPLTIEINGMTQNLTTSSQVRTIRVGDLQLGDEVHITLSSGQSSSRPYVILKCDNIAYTPNEIIGYEIKETARKVSALYTGVMGTAPIYKDITVIETANLNLTNLDKFFTVSTSNTHPWIYSNANDGLKLVPGNFGINSSDSIIELIAKQNLTNVVLSGAYYTEYDCDIFMARVEDNWLLSSASGIQDLTTLWSGPLEAGQKIHIEYRKDASGSRSDETNTAFYVTCDGVEETVSKQEIIGYEDKPVARKIIAGYIGDENGIAKQFYTSYVSPITYSGDYEVESVMIDGAPYTIYTLTSSGILECSDDVLFWSCGGGAGGGSSDVDSYGNSGGSGGFFQGGTLQANNIYPVVIGAGGLANNKGSDTIINNIAAEGGFLSYSNASGSNPGGRGNVYHNGSTVSETYYSTSRQSGMFMPTCPFGINSLTPLCAGGGAGALVSAHYEYNYDEGYYEHVPICSVPSYSYGGSNGVYYTQTYQLFHEGEPSDLLGGEGGIMGGGNGGNIVGSIPINASSATYYGSGGGGAAIVRPGGSILNASIAGNGYSGCVKIITPIPQITYSLTIDFSSSYLLKVIVDGTEYTSNRTLQLPVCSQIEVYIQGVSNICFNGVGTSVTNHYWQFPLVANTMISSISYNSWNYVNITTTY